MQIELELLAPAKNKDIGIAAIDCGADAVYIAGPKFGARESAGNSISDIAELVAYARRFGVKVYMVLNTILYDNELEEARRTVYEAYRIGCNAIIVQDLSLLKMELPPIPLFASTQTNIRTPQQAKFLEGLGFRRLILARELSLQQIAQIKSSVSADIETFVHGALCVSYSGQCYLSQRLAGRSANRGACAQACRSLYTLADSSGKILYKDTPLLSLKDFNLSNRITDLVRAGVTSFKIEGRLKNISYIKNIVKLYREKIDEFLLSAPEYIRASAGNVYGGFVPNPLLTFNRGYTGLFIDGKRGRWRSCDGAKYLGEPVGTVSSAGKDRQGFLKFTYTPSKGATSPIANGDGLCFTFGNREIAGARANSCSGTTVTTTERMEIPPKATVYRNYNIAFEKELDKNMPLRLIPVSLAIRKTGTGNLMLVAEWCRTNELEKQSCSLAITGDLQEAENIGLATHNLYNQLSKTTSVFKFELKSIDDNVSVPFLPVGRINELRRELAAKIEKIISDKPYYQTDATRDKPTVAPAECNIRENRVNRNLSYLANCSNRLSKQLYKEKGAENIAPAYELEAAPQAELMRTKYCIKYELGICPNYRNTAANDKGYIDNTENMPVNEPLFLINGKNRLQLKFDCRHCEMLVIG